MKKLIVAALLVIGFSTYAQEETETKKKLNKNSKLNFVFWNFFYVISISECLFYEKK